MQILEIFNIVICVCVQKLENIAVFQSHSLIMSFKVCEYSLI